MSFSKEIYFTYFELFYYFKQAIFYKIQVKYIFSKLYLCAKLKITKLNFTIKIYLRKKLLPPFQHCSYVYTLCMTASTNINYVKHYF